jgi:hypothetical protein
MMKLCLSPPEKRKLKEVRGRGEGKFNDLSWKRWGGEGGRNITFIALMLAYVIGYQLSGTSGSKPISLASWSKKSLVFSSDFTQNFPD